LHSMTLTKNMKKYLYKDNSYSKSLLN
jgi:hypothetical protein